jgi:hypothetical protein
MLNAVYVRKGSAVHSLLQLPPAVLLFVGVHAERMDLCSCFCYGLRPFKGLKPFLMWCCLWVQPCSADCLCVLLTAYLQSGKSLRLLLQVPGKLSRRTPCCLLFAVHVNTRCQHSVDMLVCRNVRCEHPKVCVCWVAICFSACFLAALLQFVSFLHAEVMLHVMYYRTVSALACCGRVVQHPTVGGLYQIRVAAASKICMVAARYPLTPVCPAERLFQPLLCAAMMAVHEAAWQLQVEMSSRHA